MQTSLVCSKQFSSAFKNVPCSFLHSDLKISRKSYFLQSLHRIYRDWSHSHQDKSITWHVRPRYTCYPHRMLMKGKDKIIQSYLLHLVKTISWKVPRPYLSHIEPVIDTHTFTHMLGIGQWKYIWLFMLLWPNAFLRSCSHTTIFINTLRVNN